MEPHHQPLCVDPGIMAAVLHHFPPVGLPTSAPAALVSTALESVLGTLLANRVWILIACLPLLHVIAASPGNLELSVLVLFFSSVHLEGGRAFSSLCHCCNKIFLFNPFAAKVNTFGVVVIEPLVTSSICMSVNFSDKQLTKRGKIFPKDCAFCILTAF